MRERERERKRKRETEREIMSIGNFFESEHLGLLPRSLLLGTVRSTSWGRLGPNGIAAIGVSFFFPHTIHIPPHR